MPRDAFVLKIQRELCHPKYARKVSGLLRNRPQARRATNWVLSRTQSSVERVATVESTEDANKLDPLRGELSELRHLLREQVNPESALHDLNVVSSKQSNPSLPTCQCFSCGSTTHLRRQSSRAPPVRGRERSRGRGDLHHSGPRSPLGRAQNSITCYNCGGRGHIATSCLSPHLT